MVTIKIESNENRISQTILFGGVAVRLESYSAARLAELMNEKEWDQSQLAEKSGLKQQTISRLLADKADPRRKTLEALGRALNVLWVADWINAPKDEKTPDQD